MRFSALNQRLASSPDGSFHSGSRTNVIRRGVQRLVLAFFLLLLISHFSPFISIASAQEYNQTNSYATPNTTSDVPKNLHFYTQNVMIEVMSSMICQLSGTDPTNPDQPCLGIDTKTGKIGFAQKNSGGVIGIINKSIGDLYSLPIHTGDYMNYLTSNFGAVKNVDAASAAQSPGFLGLTPLVKIWSTFRDSVYVFFVIIFILVGLAIMLRMKIDPRTVMTVENQIPKIIINIILVTLSFAIVGFLIDMMYAVSYTTTNMIVDAASAASPGYNVPNLIQSPDVFDATNKVGAANGSGWQMGDLVGTVGETIGQNLGHTFVGNLATDFVVGALSSYLATGVTKFIKGVSSTAGANPWVAVGTLVLGIGTVTFANVAGNGAISIKVFQLIVSLILLISLIWALFRLWMALLGAYISILFNVVLAPFMIFFGVIPGSSIGFGSWIRGIIANLLAFPTTIVMLLLGGLFMNIASSGEPFFAPPLTGNPGNASQMGAIIGISVIFMTPQVVKMMQELFKSEAFKYSSAIGQAIGVGQGVISGTGSSIISPYGTLQNIQRFRQNEGFSGLFKGIAFKGEVPHPQRQGKDHPNR